MPVKEPTTRTVQVERADAEFVHRRTLPLVQVYLRKVQVREEYPFATLHERPLTLFDLALWCYTQGLVDGVQLAIDRPGDLPVDLFEEGEHKREGA